MEQRLPTPAASPEMGGYQREMPKPIEAHPSRQQEALKPASVERNEKQQPSQPADPSAAPVAASLPVIAAPQVDDNSKTVASSVGDNPIAAADDDLIEREWVDKAKHIVQDTRSDPYRQEDEVSKLQADYLKKRYGKDIGLGK